jgi:hypothetical protein
MPKFNPDTYTTKDTVPLSTAVTETMTTSGKIYTLSAANTDLQAGDWVYDASQNETRQIDVVKSTTRGRLVEAFSANLSTTTIRRIANPKLVKWSVAADYGGDAAVDGETLKDGSSITEEVSQADQASGARFLAPPVVDGATNNVTVAYTTF